MYGNSLDSYSVLQAMLECGVPPDRLVLARPDTQPITSDQVALRRLLEGLKDSGVKVWDNLLLRSWVVGEEGKITGVLLHSAIDDYQIPCQAFVYVDRKHVDMQAFKGISHNAEFPPNTLISPAMNDACLVFDKRLVITHDHATNDPLIYAAGPLTKFSRRYRADQWYIKPKSSEAMKLLLGYSYYRNHGCYNSYEVGQRLALTMLTKLDPTVEPWTDPAHNLDPDLLPDYTHYKAQAAYLPGMSSVWMYMNVLISALYIGGYHYLHVYTPETKREDTNQGGDEVRELHVAPGLPVVYYTAQIMIVIPLVQHGYRKWIHVHPFKCLQACG